jgi:hypothetical protein
MRALRNMVMTEKRIVVGEIGEGGLRVKKMGSCASTAL